MFNIQQLHQTSKEQKIEKKRIIHFDKSTRKPINVKFTTFPPNTLQN